MQRSYYEDSDGHKLKESEESVRNLGFRGKDMREKVGGDEDDGDEYVSDDYVSDDDGDEDYDNGFSSDDDYDEFDYEDEDSLEEEEEEEEKEEEKSEEEESEDFEDMGIHKMQEKKRKPRKNKRKDATSKVEKNKKTAIRETIRNLIKSELDHMHYVEQYECKEKSILTYHRFPSHPRWCYYDILKYYYGHDEPISFQLFPILL